MGVAPLQEELLRPRRRHHALDDLGDVVAGEAAPVVREVIEQDRLALVPPGQPVGAGPVGAGGEEGRPMVRVGQVGLPRDEDLGEPVEERHRGLGGHEADGHPVDGLDLLERLQEERAAPADRLRPLDGRLHRLGVEDRPVVEPDVRPELEVDPRAVGGDGPRLGEGGPELGRGAPVLEQPLVELDEHPVPGPGDLDGGVDRGRLGRDREGDAPARRRRRGAPQRERRQERERGHSPTGPHREPHGVPPGSARDRASTPPRPDRRSAPRRLPR